MKTTTTTTIWRIKKEYGISSNKNKIGQWKPQDEEDEEHQQQSIPKGQIYNALKEQSQNCSRFHGFDVCRNTISSIVKWHGHFVSEWYTTEGIGEGKKTH